jgi:hypothetical protein
LGPLGASTVPCSTGVTAHAATLARVIATEVTTMMDFFMEISFMKVKFKQAQFAPR